ncbi:hypothetical protein [Streptomyces albogriseolus]|uniref:hypothetical protein n=1 Tax=Streptomyces albogriseolus TaxID=1887 RepID=UPI003515D30A
MAERGDLEPADLMAVVGGVPGAVTEGDVGPGQLPDLRIQSRMVLLDDGQVVGAASAEVGTVLVLGMQCVAGQHGVVQIDGLQQGLEGRYFVALGGDLPCRWARIVPRWSIAASSWIADRVAVRDPRTVLPSTAIARGTGFADVPDGGGGVLAWRYVPMAVSSASPSRRWSRRRTVAACGAGRMPVSGSGGKPRERGRGIPPPSQAAGIRHKRDKSAQVSRFLSRDRGGPEGQVLQPGGHG